MTGCLKSIVIVIGLILIAGAIGSLLLMTQVDTWLRDGVASGLQYVTRTDLQLKRVQILPLRQAIVITDLAIGNPATFKTGAAVKVPKLTVEFDTKTLFSRTPVIKKITMEAPEVTLRYELGQGTNLGALLGAITQKTPPSGANAHANAPAEPPSHRLFKVQELHCEQGRMSLSANLVPASVDMVLPAFSITDLGATPLGVGDITAVALRSVLRETLSVKGLLNPVAAKIQQELGQAR